LTNITGDLKILNNLKLVAQMGVNLDFGYNNATHRSFNEYNWDGSLFDVVNNPNSANYSNSKNLYKIFTAHLDYNKSFFDKHLFNLMVGASHEKNDLLGQSITGYNFASNEIFTLNLADRTQTKYADFSGNATDWALQSYFGRFSYSYDRKYLLDFTTRLDGSSKFAPSKRWSAIFPSIALAWNLAEEKFLQPLKSVNALKLRVSWGQAGNEQLATSNYGYIPLISITNNGYPMGSPNVGVPGAVSSIASPERTWETIETKNAGLDFTMLNSKLSGSFNYYIKSNHDMLVNVQLPATLGGTAPMQNVGELSTKGWDFTIGWSDKLGAFKYSVSGMISDSKNKLVKLKGSSSYSEGLVFAREGYPLNSYFGYQFEGIIKNSKQLQDYKKLGNVPANLAIGDVMYKDVDGDGKITAFGDPAKGTKGDMIYLGNLLPRYPYSLRLDFSYKRFDLGIFIQGVGKRDGVVTGESAYPFTQIWNQPLEYFYGKEYSSDNPDAKYPRIIPGALGADVLRNWNWRYSAMRVNNYAYLKLKVLTLAYNIPQSFYNKLKMQSARIYLSGTDLLTLSKGTWNHTFNPEEIWTTRTDELTYPFSSVLSFGIDIKF
jgi:TonB-linked SusC/RagA family outer membrane protein